MGIYVQGYGTFAASALDGMAERLLQCARTWAADRGLADLFYGTTIDAGVWISFYTPAGGIAFDIEPGSVSFGTKTSIACPGYHAALVDLCDRLQAQLRISWRWESGGDQTDYAVERSFTELREAFLGQVFAHCEFLSENIGAGELFAINLAEGCAMDGNDGVATPLGPIAAQKFLDALEVPGEADALAIRMYPWWRLKADEEFWVNTLRAILWTEVEWRGARTPWESQVHKATLALSERLRQVLDASLRRTIGELDSISRNCDSFTTPSPEGIGYRRRKRAFFLTGGWRINLPGYYIEQLEDDGSTVCLWFGDEAIRGTSFAVVPEAGHQRDDFVWGEALSCQPDREGGGFTYRYEPAPEPSEGHAGLFNSTAEFQTRDADGTVHLLVLSLCSAEGDSTPRISQIAERVWFDQPRSESGSHGH